MHFKSLVSPKIKFEKYIKIGRLLYIIKIFLKSIVKLYETTEPIRRNSRLCSILSEFQIRDPSISSYEFENIFPLSPDTTEN